MGKHSSSNSAVSGSIKDLFTRRKKSAGRHGGPTSAAGVLAAGRRTPVLAGIAVPTAAIATVAVAGVVGAPDGTSTSASGESFTGQELITVEQPVAPKAEDAKDYKKAQKQAKTVKASADVTVPTQEPAVPSNSRSNDDSSGSAGSSAGSASDDSDKPHNKEASGQGGTCQASMYGNGDGTDGGPTASGERFNANAMTAAHKTLPMNSRVKVTNKANGKSAIVRINDRGPYVGGRCLDLSVAAMKAVGGYSSGVISVSYEVL